MPFPFAHVCDLLSGLDEVIRSRGGPRRPSQYSVEALVRQWFDRHRDRLSRADVDACALLSTLLPERRTDRVYCIQVQRLEKVCGRALGLGISRKAELARHREPGSGVDLADCVEDILRATPNGHFPDRPGITVEDIDNILAGIAASIRFSSPAVRSSGPSPRPAEREEGLRALYTQLRPHEAKWLTRLILKDYRPVVLEPSLLFECFDPLLPFVLKVQDDFTGGIHMLRELRRSRGVVDGPMSRNELARHLKPALGLKVGRQFFFKGRSIKHCMDMCQGQRVSVESKMDGEYCQIHIDLSKGHDCIQIFSKSGKDSTQDRNKLRHAIRASLKIGRPDCHFKRGCILEGEMVVYSQKEARILEFEQIRKHVARSERFIGTEFDSPPRPWENLMVVFFDVLMIDGESLLSVKLSKRRQRLQKLVTCVTGHAQIVPCQTIDFNRGSAASDLWRMFARCITSRHEGLVLKPDDPYFDFSTSKRRFSCCSIKLKKEYIGGFGEVGDFAVVGASYEAAKAKGYGVPNLKWTSFFIGCLANKEAVHRWNYKPHFIVTNVVELTVAQLQHFITGVNHDAIPEEDNDTFSLELAPGVSQGKRPSLVFINPPVFDMRCFSFHRASNTGFWGLRFPTVGKIHTDRSYLGAIGFTDLQEMAEQERNIPALEDSQEMLRWVASLDPGGVPVDAATTQSTTSVDKTPSPVQTRRQSRILLTPLVPVLERPISANREMFIIEATQRPEEVSRAGLRTNHTTGTQQILPSHSTGSPMESRLGKRWTTSLIRGEYKAKRVKHSQDRSTTSSISSSGPLKSPSQTKQSRKPLEDITESSQDRDNASSYSGQQAVIDCSFNEGFGKEPHADGISIMRPPSPDAYPSVRLESAPPIRYTPPGSPTRRHPPPLAEIGEGARAQDHKDKTCAEAVPRSGCRLYGDMCPLAIGRLLFSPCISENIGLTGDLLRRHGMERFATDSTDWFLSFGKQEPLHEQTVLSSLGRGPLDKEGGTSRWRTKMALVEHNHKEATDEFMKRIAAARARIPIAAREWVEVYDWRLVEAITREEEVSCGTGDGGQDMPDLSRHGAGHIWKKYFVGLA